MLSDLYESNLVQDARSFLDRDLRHMEDDLQRLLRIRDFEADDIALLTQVQSTYRLCGSIKFFKGCTSVSTSRPAGRELAYTTMEENIDDMENLYSEWRK